MKYTELKEKISKEVNSFPMAFAFTNKQFEAGMTKLGVIPHQTEKVLSIGGGGYILKTDSDAFKAMFDRHNKEMAEALTDDDFLVDAIAYELSNHEYCITGDPSDALDVLDLSLDDERVKQSFNKARQEYLAGCE